MTTTVHVGLTPIYKIVKITSIIIECMFLRFNTWNTVFFPYIRPFFITAKKIYLMLNDENDITCIVIEAKTVWRLVVQNDI